LYNMCLEDSCDLCWGINFTGCTFASLPSVGPPALPFPL
jgi:hypothetical protein